MGRRERWIFTEYIKKDAVRLAGTSGRLKKDRTLDVLRCVIALRSPLPGLIHHTDRRSQNCSHDYQRLQGA
jgi:putative transposase